MKIKLIQSFVAVYEEGTFTAAARRLHATQSGLSMRIKELEDLFGLRLFDRSTNGVQPTPHAHRLYTRATRILSEISGINQEFEGLKDQLSGDVHAGLMPTITRAALAPAMDRFLSAHPLVNVRVTEAYSAVLKDEVASGKVDFAIVPPGQSVKGVKARHLATDVELFATAPNDRRRHLSPVDLTELGPIKLVLPGPSNARREKIDIYLASRGIEVASILELDAMMATLDLVARSDWCTIIPGCLGYPDIAGQRRNLHPLRPGLPGEYVLIVSASATLSPAAQAFADAISSEVSRLCADCQTAFSENSD